MASLSLFCAGSPELTDLMTAEAAECGAAQINESGAGISCTGTLETAYRLCLWSRIMNRVQFHLVTEDVETPEDIYDLARKIDWIEHLYLERTFAVHATMTASQIASPNYAGLKVKDAIADCFREKTNRRPSVDTESPQIIVHLHIKRKKATINIDLSGESLHRRGYRLGGTEAMLKETVAAAILLRADWPSLAAEGAPLIDPMCGSGTVPIEASLMAGDIAPGFNRSFGFQSWRGHDQRLWLNLLSEAKERRASGEKKIPQIAGFDIDPRAIRISRENSERAGVASSIGFRAQPIERLSPEPDMKAPGLVVLDPPYGERTGAGKDLDTFYRGFGATVKSALPGWRGALLASDPELSRSSGLWAKKINAIRNGSIKCGLALFEVYQRQGVTQSDPLESEYRDIVANRLRKNLRGLKSWSQKNQITCFRVYDADVPEFSVAIDFFEGSWAHLQEYEAPKTISRDRSKLRLDIVLETAPKILGISRESIYYKERSRQRGGDQYGRISTDGTFFEVKEGGLSFLINLSDYIDTGLFLDHRIMRSKVRDESKGKRVLNLFSYTGAVSVYAAAGEAVSVASVDLSNTYTEWAKENFELNGFFGDQFRFIRAEARKWLVSDEGEYDLIFLDPPTFSRSKSFEGTFQVQRDHHELISSALRRLAPAGVLYFSTNYRRFVLDRFSGHEVVDITAETIPYDFRRNKRIHQVYRFTKGLA